MDYDSSKSEFLEQLRSKSDSGKVEWQEDAMPDSYYVTLAGKYVARLYKQKSDTITLRITNEYGSELFDFKQLSNVTWGPLSDLMQAARRKALSLDSALDELLKDISSR